MGSVAYKQQSQMRNAALCTIYYIKLQLPFVCLSVRPFFRYDRRTATKFGTHIRVDMGLILS